MLKNFPCSGRYGWNSLALGGAKSWSKWMLVMALVLLGLQCGLATENDDRYFKIYGIIERADTFAKGGATQQALAKYREAETALRELKQIYPTYNPKLVTARLKYLSERVAELSKPPVVAGAEIEETSPVASVGKARLAGEPSVKVIEAGAEPREVLRLQAQAGNQQKIKMTIHMKMGLVAPELSSDMMSLPAMNLAATVTTKEVSTNGEAQIEIVIDEAGVAKDPATPAEAAQEMEKQMAGLKGLTMTAVVTDRYFTRKIEAIIPAGTSADQREGMEEIKDAFGNAEFLLPEVAVGVGAKWEIKKKTKQQGISVNETIRHELISRDGAKLVVKSITTQSAANQKIPNPIMPTLKVDMTKMSGTATETATIDLTRTLPIEARVEEKSEILMSVNHLGKMQPMTMKTETQSTLATD